MRAQAFFQPLAVRRRGHDDPRVARAQGRADEIAQRVQEKGVGFIELDEMFRLA